MSYTGACKYLFWYVHIHFISQTSDYNPIKFSASHLCSQIKCSYTLAIAEILKYLVIQTVGNEPNNAYLADLWYIKIDIVHKYLFLLFIMNGLTYIFWKVVALTDYALTSNCPNTSIIFYMYVYQIVMETSKPMSSKNHSVKPGSR